MTKHFHLAVLISGAALTVAAASPPPPKDLAPIFQVHYSSMKAAIAARDAKALASLLAPGFVSEDVDSHTEDANAMIRQVSGMPIDPNKASDTVIESVDLAGDTAIVRQRYHMTTTKIASGAPPKSIDLVTWSTDTWINIENTWLIQKTVTNRLEYKVDGRLVAHKDHSAPRPAEH